MRLMIDRVWKSDHGRWLRRHGKLLGNVALMAFVAIFLYQQRGTFLDGAALLRDANLTWVVIALTMQLAVIGLFAAGYRTILRRLGHAVEHWRLALLHLRRVVIMTIVPAGSPASVVVFLRALEQRGVPAGDGLLTVAIRSMAALASFAILLVPIAVFSNPSGTVIAGAALVVIGFLLAAGALFALLRGVQLPDAVERRLPECVLTFIADAHAHRIVSRDLVVPFVLALASNLLGVATLYVALLAVGAPLSLASVVAAYAVGTILLSISPIFQGAGAVELGLALALQQLGTPAAAAVAATLLFRICDIWLPLTLGLMTESATLAARPSLRRRIGARIRHLHARLGGRGVVEAA